VLSPKLGKFQSSGTAVYPKAKELDIWMGVRSPTLYHSQSFNGKELWMVLMTFQWAKESGRTDVAGTVFFYFTDNMTALHNSEWVVP
jgi:hypothetical protein